MDQDEFDKIWAAKDGDPITQAGSRLHDAIGLTNLLWSQRLTEAFREQELPFAGPAEMKAFTQDIMRFHVALMCRDLPMMLSTLIDMRLTSLADQLRAMPEMGGVKPLFPVADIMRKVRDKIVAEGGVLGDNVPMFLSDVLGENPGGS